MEKRGGGILDIQLIDKTEKLPNYCCRNSNEYFIQLRSRMSSESRSEL